MGILRLYLALCVVTAHSSPIFPWDTHDGNRSVQIFYIISGFYMALVLSSRYSNKHDFYLSRFLRIFPLYWIVLLLIVGWSLFSGWHSGQWLTLQRFVTHPFEANGMAGIGLASFSNITLFGQDWVMFLSHPLGQTFQMTEAFGKDTNPLWRYLIIPQAWSVGVELSFYVLAPFFNRLRSRDLLILVVSFFMLRFYASMNLHLNYDPWMYRFFPFEISQFLLGMLGFRIYACFRASGKSWLPSFNRKRAFPIAFVVVCVALIVCNLIENYFLGHSTWAWRSLCTYPLWAVGIAFLFALLGNNPIDRWVGELSYPVYLVHYTIAASLFPYVSKANWGLITALLSVAVAIVLYFAVIRPIDIRRHLLTIHNLRKLFRKDAAPVEVYGPGTTTIDLPEPAKKASPPYVFFLIPATILFLSIIHAHHHKNALYRMEVAGVVITLLLVAYMAGWVKALYTFLALRLQRA
ncbi:MAG: acyltransferase [Chthoniobacterales bacterium]